MKKLRTYVPASHFCTCFVRAAATRQHLAPGATLRVVLVVLLDISKVGGGAQSRARDVCEVRIRLWNRTGRISHAEALMSMSEAVVNSSPLLFRCVFVGDSSIFVTNIFSLILGISVAVLALPDGENVRSKHAPDLRFSALVEAILCMRARSHACRSLRCLVHACMPGQSAARHSLSQALCWCFLAGTLPPRCGFPSRPRSVFVVWVWCSCSLSVSS